jgi:hypothetical protein
MAYECLRQVFSFAFHVKFDKSIGVCRGFGLARNLQNYLAK